ncbi:MAG: tetraacyldisaccharide 4'-kinase [Arenimonas sp.]|nr:tetraacyldisaccharide 4'-kinase [Arenimonas sp.]MBP7917560.1 tetraacyldisaccharide 4'-kinase [Arenimonas sp.]
MRGLESWLNGIWYGGEKPPFALKILACLYALILRFRKPVSTDYLGAPVIVVGNLTAGGTGKTPLIIALVARLKASGFRPGVVSRGYGRKSRRPVSVDAGCDPDDSGDEPFLIAKRTLAPVRVDADRRRAAQFLIAQGCDVIVSDDGLQHRALPRMLEIEVFDAQRGYGNGRLLPAGPLREPLRPTDVRVGNGLSGDQNDAFAMRLHMSQCYHLNSGELRALAAFRGRPIQAVAGIGHPQRFFNALAEHGLSVQAHPFPDHHRFTSADLPESGPVLMTEKDAVKCLGIIRDDIWAVPVDALLSEAFMERIIGRLTHTKGHA